MDDTKKDVVEKKHHEIDVIGVLGKIFQDTKTLVYFCVVFAILGVVVALNSQRLYTTTVVLAPESADASSMAGKLGSMTSMLGISLGANPGSDAIYPDLYPDVFASTDFQLSLFEIPVTQGGETKSKPYSEHLLRDITIPFWSYPSIWISKLFSSAEKQEEEKQQMAAINDINPFSLTKKQWAACNLMRNRITCVVDKKTSIITMSVTDVDPQVAALVADTVMHRLQNYITDYRTKKARTDMESIEKMNKEAYDDYLKSQAKYAKAVDSHQNLILKAYQTEIENMENEMQICLGVYTETSQQLQVARQRVQERTPVFTVIQSPTIAEKPSSTPRSIIVIGYVFLGCVCDALWVLFVRDWWMKRRKKKVAPDAEVQQISEA